MADLAHEETLREIVIADEEKVHARNYVLGRFGFTDGVKDPGKFPETREMLGALGLAWKVPPGTMPIKDLDSALEIDPTRKGVRSRRRREAVR